MKIKKLLSAAAAGIGVIFGIIPTDCKAAVDVNSLEGLLKAIAQVESNGDSSAYNHKENAAGPYQIRPVYLKDVNRIVGYEKYRLEDRFDALKAKEMVVTYLSHYGKHKSLEALARIHNGGPRGDKKKSTLRYWQKVKKAMEAK